MKRLKGHTDTSVTYWVQADGYEYTFIAERDEMETEDMLVYVAYVHPELGIQQISGMLRGEHEDNIRDNLPFMPEGTVADGPWFPWERELTP